MKSALDLIKERRSIRRYQDRVPSDDIIRSVIEAGRRAPSGLNNQPWRFAIIKDRSSVEKISSFTRYSTIIKSAPVLIAVFMDNKQSYNRDKDLQAIGACIENILLAVHALGLGACWLGEILNKGTEVCKYLEVPGSYELMAVLSLGYPAEKGHKSPRTPLSQLICKELL